MSGPACRIVVCRALRGVVDGLVSVLLAGYLLRLAFTPVEIGAIVTGTLLGSAALTTAVGLAAHAAPRRSILLGAAALMLMTGLGFFAARTFWPLLIVAVVGTLNPSAGDVSVFLPAEQAALVDCTAAHRRANAFAWYNVAGTLAGALGALAAVLPPLIAQHTTVSLAAAERGSFLVYAAVAVATAAIYAQLPAIGGGGMDRRTAPLARSRGIVLRLAALFSLDSFGGGFVVQSLLVLWLYQRFGLSTAEMAGVFFTAGVLGAFSQLVSPWLARRIGYVRTMVYTHLPANAFLILAGVVPSAPAAVALLLGRAALSQMDVPARQAYVMSVVPSVERAAAASITNVPRSLAAAIPPLLTGSLLAWSSLGWPLLIGGLLKATYDLALLHQFRSVHPQAADTV
jgi:MFS family permease